MRDFTLAIWVLFHPVCGLAENECQQVVVAQSGYSVCVPADWYHREMRSGALFLCSESGGHCTISGGGLPATGHATLSIVVLNSSDSGDEALIKAAKGWARHDAADISSVRRLDASGGNRYLTVRREFSMGGLNEVPKKQEAYFVLAAGRLYRMTLMFNLTDSRQTIYRSTVLDIARTLRPR